MSREELISQNIDLFWYHEKSKLNTISDEVLVEFILNYGDMQSVKDLFACLGIEKVAEIFAIESSKTRQNFLPQVKHYFHLLFNKYAPQYFI